MPRAISDRRKNLAALSREVSEPSSHRFWRGSRNPDGGGPAGKADLVAEVEKVAAVATGMTGCCDGRAEMRLLKGVNTDRVLDSIARDLVVAIVC